MIYCNNSSVKLYGEVADNFLEEVGVGIFDDGDITIGESIFDLSTGCDILEESGIVLCEDCIVLEGKQAEEYKARKAAEKRKTEDEDWEEYYTQGYGKMKHAGPGSYKGWNHPKFTDADLKKDRKLEGRMEDFLLKQRRRYEKEGDNARDRAYAYRDKAQLFRNKQADQNLSRQGQESKKRRYEDTANKYEKMSNDSHNKADVAYGNANKTHYGTVGRSVSRYLKNQDRIARSKKSTVQHNSTIFSNVEII